jgi:hypothetical protein
MSTESEEMLFTRSDTRARNDADGHTTRNPSAVMPPTAAEPVEKLGSC